MYEIILRPINPTHLKRNIPIFNCVYCCLRKRIFVYFLFVFPNGNFHIQFPSEREKTHCVSNSSKREKTREEKLSREKNDVTQWHKNNHTQLCFRRPHAHANAPWYYGKNVNIVSKILTRNVCKPHVTQISLKVRRITIFMRVKYVHENAVVIFERLR